MQRFRVGATYDPSLDIWNTKEGRRMKARIAATPLDKRKQRQKEGREKAARKNAPKIAAKKAARATREEAEERAAETVRIAVRAMLHALHELQDVPVEYNYTRKIHPHAVHNAILTLKKQCGIVFPPEELADLPAKKHPLDKEKGYVPLWERNKDDEEI